MGAADVGRIVAAAGVAHGTFYFHFPSKEHVLLDLKIREETRVSRELAEYLKHQGDLEDTLREVVRLVVECEERLGAPLCREILALNFSLSRPRSDDWADHPVIVQLVDMIEHARALALIHPDADAFRVATLFVAGLYGALTTTDNHRSRQTVLAELVANAMGAVEA